MTNTILIVDDDETNLDLLSVILKSDEYTILRSDNGRAALEMLKQQPVDLVLLDLMMPVIDGYQVLRVMRNDAKLQSTPVVVITAVGKRESVKHCILLGAKDYVLKPFEPTDVRTRVAASLDRKRMHDIESALRQQLQSEKQRADDLLNDILPSGLALAKERHQNRLLENLVAQAMIFCRADAGILYMRTGSDSLKYEVVRNLPLGIFMGGTTNLPCPYSPLLLMQDSEANEKNEDFAVTHAFHSGKPVRLDLDGTGDGGFSTTRIFNESEVFRAITFLATPLKTPAGEVIGVLELINSKDAEKDFIVPFTAVQQEMMEVLCQLAALAIEMGQLRQRAGG